MHVRAMVLEQFNEPLIMREYPLSPLDEGEVLVRIRAAGVCGSDVHIWRGRDPRTPLPIILGHEGVGEIAELKGAKRDVFGRSLQPGDLVVWERGIVCGRCEFCVIRQRPALCPHRRTYGISISSKEPPHLRGAYAEYIHLLASAHLIRVDEDIDPAALVAATCSGATAAHTIEQAQIAPGDTVVILGPGPMALFIVALARAAGAGRIIVFGSRRSAARLEVAKALGADTTVLRDETTVADRVQMVRELTHGMGAPVVIECAGTVEAVEEAVQHTAPYGKCLVPGVATPIGPVAIPVFESIARRNVRLQGVWVSDVSHLNRAVQLVLSGRFPFEKLVTHRLPLDQATEALEAVERREAVKAVLAPTSR